MPRTVDATHDWLQRAIGQPDFAQRLALAASGAGGVVFDHADEAAAFGRAGKALAEEVTWDRSIGRLLA